MQLMSKNPILALILLLTIFIFFFNCKSTEHATRLEKWSWMMEQEKEIFQDSISEFGKLKPLVERKNPGNEIVYDEYLLIIYSTENFADEICKTLKEAKLIKDTHYILNNDKEDKIPCFDEFATALDFQISNYEELHQYFMKKELKFNTKDIKELCKKFKCDREPNRKELQDNAKLLIEELKLYRSKIRLN